MLTILYKNIPINAYNTKNVLKITITYLFNANIDKIIFKIRINNIFRCTDIKKDISTTKDNVVKMSPLSIYNTSLQIKLNPLCQWQSSTIIDRIRLSAHICFPAV